MDLVRARRAVALVSCAFLLSVPARAHAQVFEAISSYAGCDPAGCVEASDGGRPDSALVIGPDGNFYGTTSEFPSGGLGTIYRVTPSGGRTTLVNFSEPTDPAVFGPWGCFPVGKLAKGPDAFYGVTDGCGLNNGGVLYSLSFSGSFTVLHHFPTGASPSGGLAFATDGDLFGITGNGGDFNQGTVFRWDGVSVSTIFSFGSSDAGGFPAGDLMRASDGGIYGATTGGGGIALPTLFRITSDEAVELFHTFDGAHGYSNGGLLEASDGQLYGATYTGMGVVFRIALDGTFTPLHTGLHSRGNLIEGFGGVIYGTTDEVSSVSGTVFQMRPSGALTTLHTFDAPGGRRPRAGLLRGSDGHMYGNAYEGGSHGLGVFYRIAMPPAVDVTANGAHGPLTLAPGEPLAIRVAFEVPGAGVLNPAQVLIGFVSPVGVYWLGPAGFGTTPVVLFAGALPAFGATPLLNFSTTAGLPAGNYTWFMFVVEGTTRLFADSVTTTVP